MRRGLPATRVGGIAHHFQFGNGPEAQAGWEERRRVQGPQHYGRHPPALGSPQEGDQVPMGLPAALGSSRLEQIRQRKKRACQPELSVVSPKPTRVVEQPMLKKALVTGAGTAEKDHSKQEAHQDDTG